MNTMALTRPAERHGCLLRLTAGPAAAAEARRQVRAALADWQAPVDADVAVLLASDLVTSVLRDQPGTALTLVVRHAGGTQSRAQRVADPEAIVLDAARSVP